jgi:hypothetical protein
LKKFGDTAGLFGGERILVTYGDITVGATFVAGVQGEGKKMVELDGTGELVCVPGWTITKEPVSK